MIHTDELRERQYDVFRQLADAARRNETLAYAAGTAIGQLTLCGLSEDVADEFGARYLVESGEEFPTLTDVQRSGLVRVTAEEMKRIRQRAKKRRL